MIEWVFVGYSMSRDQKGSLVFFLLNDDHDQCRHHRVAKGSSQSTTTGFGLPHLEAGAADDHKQTEPYHGGETAGQRTKALGGMELVIPCKAAKAFSLIFMQRIVMTLLRQSA